MAHMGLPLGPPRNDTFQTELGEPPMIWRSGFIRPPIQWTTKQPQKSMNQIPMFGHKKTPKCMVWCHTNTRCKILCRITGQGEPYLSSSSQQTLPISVSTPDSSQTHASPGWLAIPCTMVLKGQGSGRKTQGLLDLELPATGCGRCLSHLSGALPWASCPQAGKQKDRTKRR